MIEQLGRYELHEELGRGGMAVVYAGVAAGVQGFRKPVVVKRIHPHLTRDRRFVDLLIREAKLTVRLDHPNVVQVLELGREGDDYFIVLERVHGCDLALLLESARASGVRFPPRLAGHVAREVLSALHYAHGVRGDDGSPLGIVHRDISPTNVLVARDGRVRLTDFGIARTALGGEATEGGLKGKLPYMSPEQARGEPVGPAGDLYATGLVLFEMLAGRRALEGDAELVVLEAARRGALEQIDRAGDAIPADFHEPLRRALQPAARDRHADARAMRAALAPWSHGPDEGQERLAELVALVRPEAAAGTPPPAAETRPPPAPRTQTLVTRADAAPPPPAPLEAPAEPRPRPRPWAALAVAAVGLAAVLVVLWSPWERPAEPAGGPDEVPPAEDSPASEDPHRASDGDAAGEPAPPAPGSTLAPGLDHGPAAATGPSGIAPGAAVAVAEEPPTATGAAPDPTPAPRAAVATGEDVGQLTVVVQGGTGLVHLDAPGWNDRYAPLSAVEVPAGRWLLRVHHAGAGTLWSGTVEVPAGGSVGLLLEPAPGGGWKATLR